MEETTISTNGVDLHVMLDGPEDGPPVLLLHGFPEFWYGWKHQIPALTDAGFRVIAPDQRGYNKSSRPRAVEAYTTDKLAADAAGLIEALGYEDAFVVGHDWGAMVAWYLALTYPEHVRKLLIANVPHPGVFGKYLRSNPAQMLKSWYVGFFQIPGVPEFMLRLGNWALAERSLRRSSHRGTFTAEDFVRYKKAWARPGAMRGMINWYRAFRMTPKPPRTVVTPPTLIIWGKRDSFIEPELAELSIEKCEDGRLIMVDSATHWVQHEVPDMFNHKMIGFFHD